MKVLKVILLIGISISSFSVSGVLGEMTEGEVKLIEPQAPLRVFFNRAFPIMDRVLDEVMEVYMDVAYDCEAERSSISPEVLEAKKINIHMLGRSWVTFHGGWGLPYSSEGKLDFEAWGGSNNFYYSPWEWEINSDGEMVVSEEQKRIFVEMSVGFGFDRGTITHLIFGLGLEEDGMTLRSKRLDGFQEWKRIALGEEFNKFRKPYCVDELVIKDAEKAVLELVMAGENRWGATRESKLDDLQEQLRERQYRLLDELLKLVLKRDVIFYGEEPDQLRAKFYETIYDGRKELIPIYEREMAEKYKHFSREEWKDLERALRSVSLK